MKLEGLTEDGFREMAGAKSRLVGLGVGGEKIEAEYIGNSP